MRLQKGDPAHAFEKERAGLIYLAQKGVAVPEIVLSGEDYFVLADAGPTLVDLAETASGKTAFAAAGRALGQLHGAGLIHGRPAVRDICYQDGKARFIDLERFDPRRKSFFWQAMDVLIFSHSADVQWAEAPYLVETALAAYLETAPAGAKARVGRLARGLFWLGALARGIAYFRPKSRDIRAYDLTLRRLSQWR